MAARSGMSALIEQLRGMTETAAGDWMQGTANYWDDDHLQGVLDDHQLLIYNEPITPLREWGAGGTLLTKRYPTGYQNLEASSGGTAIFYLLDGSYNTVGTALYSTDYRRGLVTFAANTAGSTYYLTGYSYDLNAAAADVWEIKANHYASAYDVSTDNHNLKRSQLYDHCRERVAHFRMQAGPRVVWAERSDT